MSRPNWSKILKLTGLLIALVLAMFCSLRGGAFDLDWNTISAILQGDVNSVQGQIITEIRLPRIIIGVLIGGALAISGAILQAVLHNILASPGIIGVSAGAGLGGILVLLIFPGWSMGLLPAAFLGGLAAVGVVMVLTWHGGASPGRLILSGVAVSSLFSAISSFILLWHSERAGGVLDFTIGSLSNRGWERYQNRRESGRGGCSAAARASSRRQRQLPAQTFDFSPFSMPSPAVLRRRESNSVLFQFP